MSRATRSLTAMALVLGACLATAATADSEAAQVSQQKSAKKKPGGKPKKGSTRPSPDAPKPKEEGATPTAAASKDGSLKFSRDIAPILVANCSGCHNAAHRSGLNQTTFEGLLKGGKAGPAIVANKPEESLLVSRIKGEEGAKMPPGNRDLSAASIEKIERWVKEGATLDPGHDAKAEMKSYASTPEQLRKAELAKMSPDDRDKKTEAAGLERLKKANAKAEPEIQKGSSFLLFSNLPKERASPLLKGLDGQFRRINGLLTVERDKPALGWPEKVSIYLFKDRSGYVEFVRSIENQDAEESEVARSKLTVESPYIVAIDPLAFGPESPGAATKKGGRSKKSDDLGGPERTLAGVLTEAFAAGSVAQAGGPGWVSEGIGAFMASQVEPRSPYYNKLRQQAYQQWKIGWPSKATEALGGQAKGETARAIGLAIFEWINGNASPIAFATFVQGMLQGQAKLDDAIQAAFGLNREQFLAGSGNWVMSRYGRGR